MISGRWVSVETVPGVVHVRLRREGDWPPFESEEVAAIRIDDHRFQLTAAPAFAKRLASGDVVRVAHYGSSADPWVEEVLVWSGNSTIRVIVFAPGGKSIEEELAKELGALGGLISPSVLYGLFVVNVPREVEYGQVRAFLDGGESCGMWEFEEAAISANHAGDSQ